MQPVTFTPAASASRTACQPLNAGSSAGCVLTTRPPNASRNGSDRIVPKPAIATRSTSWRSSAATTSLVYATRSKAGPKSVRSTSSARDPGLAGDVERAARAVGEHDRRPGGRGRASPGGWCRFPKRERRPALPRTLAQTLRSASPRNPRICASVVFHSSGQHVEPSNWCGRTRGRQHAADAGGADDPDRGRGDARRVVLRLRRAARTRGAPTCSRSRRCSRSTACSWRCRSRSTKFAERERCPSEVLGFTWEQVHLVFGLLAGFMAIGWLVTDIVEQGHRLLARGARRHRHRVGAVMLQRERNTGAIG